MKPQYTYGLDQSVDESVWTTALTRMGAALSALVNEFVSIIQFICNPTQSPGSYEKAGFSVQGVQCDPSDYAKGITRDCVSVSAVTQIKDTMTGRAWGAYAEVGVVAGADGFAVGQEIGMNNNGSEQPSLDTATSKVAQSIVAGEYPGNKNVTASRYVAGGTAKFFNGDIFEQNGFVAGAAVVGIRNQDGIIASLRADGTLQLRYIMSPTRPVLQPGTMALWGNTSTQTISLIFYDGGNYFSAQMPVVV